MIEIIDAIRRLIDNAMADGVPCLLGTVDGKGRPQIGPKGSVMVYDDAADWLLAMGVTSGCTTSTYCPQGLVTRAEMFTFLHRLEGLG